MYRRTWWCMLACCGALLAGCGGQIAEEPRGSAPPSPTYETGRGAGGGSQRERQAAMLNRIRQTDPRHETIERAVFNERNELGVILSRSVAMDDIPKLMRSLLPELAREFPGQDLTIVAYAPTEPPARLGVARLDARTRQMTYTSDQR